MMFVSPLENQLMSSIAEWSIAAHLAVAKFKITTFAHVESHWSVSSDKPFALSIAHWGDLTMATTAPVVGLASVQVHVGWVDTGIGWHAWWSVSSFLVWSAFAKRNDFVFWEIGDIVH